MARASRSPTMGWRTGSRRRGHLSRAPAGRSTDALRVSMRTENAIERLRLLQLFDSQFPVGAFAHSGGLETYAQAGGGLDVVRALLIDQIELGWGRGDLAAASLAWNVAADARPALALDRLSTAVSAFKVIPAVRDASLKLGAR